MRTETPGKSRSFLDAEVIAKLTPIPLLSRRPMLGSVSGRHASPHRGSSVEFAEYRKYVPGDDPRRLDWRAAGRSDRFYVKEFEADTNLRCIFVVDTSGSMAFESPSPVLTGEGPGGRVLRSPETSQNSPTPKASPAI